MRYSKKQFSKSSYLNDLNSNAICQTRFYDIIFKKLKIDNNSSHKTSEGLLSFSKICDFRQCSFHWVI